MGRGGGGGGLKKEEGLEERGGGWIVEAVKEQGERCGRSRLTPSTMPKATEREGRDRKGKGRHPHGSEDSEGTS